MPSFIPRKGPGGKRVWQAHVRRRGYSAQVRTFDTKAEAEAWAAIIESEIARGIFVSRGEAEATTLAEALGRYEEEITKTKRASTASREMYTIRWWQSSSLGQRPLASIRGKDIAAALKAKVGAAPHTIHLHLAVISHLFTVARKRWGMEGLSNPAELVHKPRLPQGRDRRLVDDEQARLLSAAATYDEEVGPVITWAIETAMRRGEIVAMRWEHVDRTASTLLVSDTKTGTPHRIPVHDGRRHPQRAAPAYRRPCVEHAPRLDIAGLRAGLQDRRYYRPDLSRPAPRGGFPAL